MASVLPPSGELTVTVVETCKPALFEADVDDKLNVGAGLIASSFLQEDKASIKPATAIAVTDNTLVKMVFDFMDNRFLGERLYKDGQNYRYTITLMLPQIELCFTKAGALLRIS